MFQIRLCLEPSSIMGLFQIPLHEKLGMQLGQVGGVGSWGVSFHAQPKRAHGFPRVIRLDGLGGLV